MQAQLLWYLYTDSDYYSRGYIVIDCRVIVTALQVNTQIRTLIRVYLQVLY